MDRAPGAAQRRLSTVARVVFGFLTDWLDRRRALRNFRRPAAPPETDFTEYADEQIGLARDALAAGYPAGALAIFNKIRPRFPQRIVGTRAGRKVLLDLGFFDDAEALVLEARKRYPRYSDFAVGYAEVAFRRGDLPEALRRLKTVRRKFALVAEGYTIAAACLRRLDRPEELEAMMRRALRKLPNDLEVLVEHARQAEYLMDWEAALQRWQAAREHSDTLLILINISACLRMVGRYAEAEAAAKSISSRFPSDHSAYIELAKVAMARGDFEEAARRWETLRMRNPFVSIAYTAGADAARHAGRDAEADEILGKGVGQLSSDLDVHLEYARSAQRRSDHAAAAERWALVHERFPNCDEAHANLPAARPRT